VNLNERGKDLSDNTELLKGVLEGCVLEVISREQTYGYDITERLRELGFADLVEGTVYAILLRCEKNGLIRSNKRPSSIGPPRKVYALTRNGRAELKLFWRKWHDIASKINKLRRRKW
jgi:DNA-binding PadR family transcriptional regulator